MRNTGIFMYGNHCRLCSRTVTFPVNIDVDVCLCMSVNLSRNTAVEITKFITTFLQILCFFCIIYYAQLPKLPIFVNCSRQISCQYVLIHFDANKMCSDYFQTKTTHTGTTTGQTYNKQIRPQNVPQSRYTHTHTHNLLPY